MKLLLNGCCVGGMMMNCYYFQLLWRININTNSHLEILLRPRWNQAAAMLMAQLSLFWRLTFASAHSTGMQTAAGPLRRPVMPLVGQIPSKTSVCVDQWNSGGIFKIWPFFARSSSGATGLNQNDGHKHNHNGLCLAHIHQATAPAATQPTLDRSWICSSFHHSAGGGPISAPARGP